jgi:hypothetical protein
VLYYAFAILVVPLQHELQVETWIVTGAFSVALLMSAAAAPAVGRWADRGQGPQVMQVGGFTATGLLLSWTLLPGVTLLYFVWAGLGLCLAATLYEPAFVIVGRAYREPAARLRAIATITLFGGLASTTFLPATALLVSRFGWRGAVIVLAILVGLSTWLTGRHAFRGEASGADEPTNASGQPPAEATSPLFILAAGLFTLATLASSALVANLLPALGEKGVAPTAAALVGSLMGVMQLPGRALLMSGVLAGSPERLLSLSLALHAGGLGLVAFGHSTPTAAAGTMVFALGAGLTTLVRPYLVQTLFGTEATGFLNGRIARQQQLARAAGPTVVAWLATRLSYGTVFAAFAALFVIAGLTALATLGRTADAHLNEQAAE